MSEIIVSQGVFDDGIEDLMAAARKGGATEEQAYQMIVEGARRTNTAVDSRFEPDDKGQQ